MAPPAAATGQPQYGLPAQDAGQGFLLPREALLVLFGGRFLTLLLTLAILFEEEAGHIRVGIGVPRPPGQELFGRDRFAGFPASAQLLQELALQAAGTGEGGDDGRGIEGAILGGK